MSDKVDVAIVSARGRGQWLATELRSLGLEVSLIDSTEHMGSWSPEDKEGPFGFFQSEQIKSSQITRLLEEDYMDPVLNGFCVWLKEGPFEFLGPLYRHHEESLGLSELCESYLSKREDFSYNQKVEVIENLHRLPFKATWPVHLAHQLAANYFCENSAAIDRGEALSVYSPLHIRRVSRRSYEKSLKWCESKGVNVFTEATLEDIRVSGSKVEGLEVKASTSGFIQANKFIWMLTGEESFRFKHNVYSQIYPSGHLKSEWSWVKFLYQIDYDEQKISVPNHFVIIEDLYLTWAHQNLLIAVQTVSSKKFDVWIRIPSQQRFNRSYIEDLDVKIKSLLTQRMANSEVSLEKAPQEYEFEYDQLGPSPFPVYASQAKAKNKKNSYKNLWYSSPEDWKRLDWSAQFDHQSLIFSEIEKMINTEREQMKNREARS